MENYKFSLQNIWNYLVQKIYSYILHINNFDIFILFDNIDIFIDRQVKSQPQSTSAQNLGCVTAPPLQYM